MRVLFLLVVAITTLPGRLTAQQVAFSEEVPLSYRGYTFYDMGRVGPYYYSVRTNRKHTFFEVDVFHAATLRHRATFTVPSPARVLAFRPADSVLKVWGEDYTGGEVLLIVTTYGLDGRLHGTDTLLKKTDPSLVWQRHFTIAPRAHPSSPAVGVWFPRNPRRKDDLEVRVFSNATHRLLWHRNEGKEHFGEIFPLPATPIQAPTAFRKDRLVQRDQWYYIHASAHGPTRYRLLDNDSIQASRPRLIRPFYDSLAPVAGYLGSSPVFPERIRGYGWLRLDATGKIKTGFRRWPMELVRVIRGMDARSPFIENLKLLAVHPLSGGRCLYVTEINYKRAEIFRQTTAFGQVQTTRRIYYFSEEVLVFLTDSTHRIAWYQLLRKHQVSQDDEALYSSVGQMIQQTRLILFYNNMHQRYWNNEMWEVSPTGGVRRRVLFTQKKHPLNVIWRMGRQVSYQRFIAPAYTRRGDRYRLVRIHVPAESL